MTIFWTALHFAGFTVWLGGLISVAILRGQGRRPEDASPPDLSPIYRGLVGPGAMATVVSGLVLTLRLYGEASGDGFSAGVMAMQALGLAAALVSLIVSVPTAARLARLEATGPSAVLFGQLERRLRWSDLLVLAAGTVAIAAGIAGR